MPLMSIIGCEIFVKEISQLLGKDGDIESLIIMSEKKSDIVKQLHDLGAKYEELSPDMLPMDLKERKGLNVIVDLQSVSLHNDKSKIKKETYEKIKFYGKISGGILLLYGVQNDAFADVLSDFKKSKFQLMTLICDEDKVQDRDMCNCTVDGINEGLLSPYVLDAYEKSYSELKNRLTSKGN
ncbi:hypothetical protein V7O62_13780 [Methanolobus sp. ZRKC2]|uniref:hypothetical protein n=1 Tax=Methanolobus sp. ZRKC2 TaxID=3125783 RepID=UPI0032557945